MDNQTTKEFNSFEEDSVDNTTSTAVLVKRIKEDRPDKKLIVATIQKLANAVQRKQYAKAMSKYQDEKIVIIFDECHRSTFGKMMRDIRKTFTNSQIFGFTGTPRFAVNKSQDGRTTEDIFGKCLHSYLIKDAIKDNNVLGFNVEHMSTFAGEYDIEDKTKVEDIDRKEVYESEERINKISKHIVTSFPHKSHYGKYCAMLATSSINALIKYYDAFKNDPNNKLKAAAIFSYNPNEETGEQEEHSREALDRIMSDYNKMFGTKHSTENFAGYNTDISKSLKKT